MAECGAAKDLNLKAGDELCFEYHEGNEYRIVSPCGQNILDIRGYLCGRVDSPAIYTVVKRATPATGTLVELGVKAGDVVQSVEYGHDRIVSRVDGMHVYYSTGGFDEYDHHAFRIISRASDTPTLWGEMTDAEKGALLAKHEGKTIEWFSAQEWVICKGELWRPYTAYRIKPKTVQGSLKALNEYGVHTDTFIVNYVDGKPDMTSVKPIS